MDGQAVSNKQNQGRALISLIRGMEPDLVYRLTLIADKHFNLQKAHRGKQALEAVHSQEAARYLGEQHLLPTVKEGELVSLFTCMLATRSTSRQGIVSSSYLPLTQGQNSPPTNSFRWGNLDLTNLVAGSATNPISGRTRLDQIGMSDRNW